MIVSGNELISKASLTRHLLQNPRQWVDLYDTEHIDCRMLRRATRLMLYFWPRSLYSLGLARVHAWPETYALLGLSALECNDVEMAIHAYEWLMEDAGQDTFWGLPIKWHSGQYVYPARTMMSTTTAEVASFLVQLDKECGCVGHDTLERIGWGLVHGLYRAIDDGDRLQFSYTPYPSHPVNNSNLLVAASLWSIGTHAGDVGLMSVAERVTGTCLDCLDPAGGITYSREYGIVDSYHQLFSIRALYVMRDMNSSVRKWFDRTLSFLESHFMDTRGGLLVQTDRPMYDVISSAEALRLYRMIGSSQRYDRILEHMRRDLTSRDNLVQRAWLTPLGLVRANTLFTRQGAARLALALAP